MRSTDQENALRELARSVASSFGLELYDLVFRRTGPRWKLQIFISRTDGNVGLADCERVSRQLSRELDVSDPIAHTYDLEVSSPGVERVLRETWHFERAVGESVAVRWRDESGRARTDTGVLESADGGRIVLKTGESSIAVGLDAVLSARIHVEW